MKYESALTGLAVVAIALTSLDSVSSFVPQSVKIISPTNKVGLDQSQLNVASSEIVGEEAETKPRKTREVSSCRVLIELLLLEYGCTPNIFFGTTYLEFLHQALTHSSFQSTVPSLTGTTRSSFKGIASALCRLIHSSR